METVDGYETHLDDSRMTATVGGCPMQHVKCVLTSARRAIQAVPEGAPQTRSRVHTAGGGGQVVSK